MLIIDALDDNKSENWSATEMIEETKRLKAALNKTARQAVKSIKADMSSRFTMRANWVQKGIRFDAATVDDLEARVYSIDPYMVKQEEGETYHPDGHVAIPREARPSSTSLIPRSMFPNALRGRKDVFKFNFSNPAWKPYPLNGIFQRVMGSKHLRILYLLKNEKKTKPIWQFGPQVEETVDEYFERYYDDIESYGPGDIVG